MTECSDGTMVFYRVKLGKFFDISNPDTATEQSIERFLLQFKNPGNRHAYFRAIRTFYNWREHRFGLPSPMVNMKAPRLGKLIMPSLEYEQVLTLIQKANNNRDKAIIALFTESGMRLSELTNIRVQDIDWNNSIIKTIGKGNKEGFAPFGAMSEQYLKQWLAEYNPNSCGIWGLNKWGITTMLRRLDEKTGLPCNPHTFRRTFACLLRKAGVDTMTIKDLGRWESLEMVQRYTRSVTFHDSLKLYKAPLS
ncbi:MAG: tyrosine-type recombinase/integrase [Chloroflexi bacterium]|nr:tyrosine-type recombinase/integrase [Chloroflexota bacterium]